MLTNICNVKTVFICPDHNEKYEKRKNHVNELLTRIGIKNFTHFKSGTESYPSCLSLATVEILKCHMDDNPILILEDDVEWTGIYNFNISSKCDAIYLGLSKSAGHATENIHEGSFQFLDLNTPQVKVINMLGGHAVVYITQKYKQAVVDILLSNNLYYNDVLMSTIQKKYNVIANKIPLFFQSQIYDGNEEKTKFFLKTKKDPFFSFDNHLCTIVSAYYVTGTKKNTHETYMKWIKNFFTLGSPIVLFTSPDLVDILKQLRGSKPIHIISLPFEELTTWKKYDWEGQHHIDKEKNIHSPDLYCIWAEKSFFVERVVDMNPFNTKFFYWCDAGAFRTDNMSEFYNFPMTNYFIPEKILFNAVGQLQESDKILYEDGIIGNFDDLNISRVIGGMWGGDATACKNWRVAYENMLNKYVKANRFYGKDQHIMLSAYLEKPSLGVFTKKPDGRDMWMYIHYVLSGKDYLEYDFTYHILP